MRRDAASATQSHLFRVVAAAISLAAAPGLACVFTLDPPLEPIGHGGSAGKGGASADSGGAAGGLSGHAGSPGDAGSAGEAGGGPDGADMGDGQGCISGTTRCEVGKPQHCSADGKWIDQAACAATATCVAGGCVTIGPSCDGVQAACGPTAESHCCESSVVVGGTFNRSYDAVTYKDEGFPATVADFRLDNFEVTVGRFRKFVQGWPGNKPALGAGPHASIPGSGWDTTWDVSVPGSKADLVTALKCDTKYQTWTDAPAGNETRPINCVTWFEAFAFCAWDGGRLPTEAEWNYAAAGGSEQRAYPWSSPSTSTDISPQQASYFVNATQMCMGDGSSGCTLADLVFVGAKGAGAGKWGQSDLSGNAMEWVLDYHASAYPQPCNNCANLVSSSNRVVRGGSFDLEASSLLASFRFAGTPEVRRYYYGIRCARSL